MPRCRGIHKAIDGIFQGPGQWVIATCACGVTIPNKDYWSDPIRLSPNLEWDASYEWIKPLHDALKAHQVQRAMERVV